MFHPKRKAVPKQSSIPTFATLSSSGTSLSGRQPAARTTPLRHYSSETKLSTVVNQPGKFNSEIKRTDFLAEAKMRARRIAQSPKRFQEEFARNSTPSPANFSNSGTNLSGSQPATRTTPLRHYASETKLSAMVNQTGKFNSELKRTGFLAEAKMRARRIAQNPKRFLEEYAKNHEHLEIVPTEIPELESFVDKLALTDRFAKKDAELRTKAEAAKSRTFLLSMAAASSIDLDTTDEFIGSYSKEAGDGDHNDPDLMTNIVNQYLEELKGVNTEMINEWLTQFYDLKDLNLPYGLPGTLRIPNDPTTLENLNNSTSEFIESSHDNFLLLDGEYHAKLEDVTKELKNNFDCIHHTGWDVKDTGLLFYVLNALDSSVTAAHFTPLQLELTSRLFPDKGRKVIIQQKYRLKTKKTLEEKRSSIIRAWMRDKSDLEAKVNLAWQEVNKKRLAEMEQKISLRKQADLCAFWAEQVEKMRKEKCLEIKKIRILIEPAEKFRANAAKSITEQEERRRQGLRANFQKYREKQWNEKVHAYQEKQLMLQMAEDLARTQAASNKTRVSYRKEKWTEKDRERRQLEEAMEQEHVRRQIALENTKDPVQIEYDPASVVMDTHSSMVRRFNTLKQQKDPEEDGMVGLFREVYSFTAETILKDRRVRLESKLREAGLMNTSYARQVLMAMQPPIRPHLKSQIKFDD